MLHKDAMAEMMFYVDKDGKVHGAINASIPNFLAMVDEALHVMQDGVKDPDWTVADFLGELESGQEEQS